MAGYKDVKLWRLRTKQRLVEAFGGRCAVCGLVDSHVVYDFHHVVPGEKERCITSGIKPWSWMRQEATKCAMLCALCHRKIHGGMAELPADWQRFDERLIVTVAPRAAEPCPVCGGPKRPGTITCGASCSRKWRSKIDWNAHDLSALYVQEGSFLGVARRIGGISDVSVKKRMISEGLLQP